MSNCGCINIKRHRLSEMQRLIIVELQGSYTDKYGILNRQYYYLANIVAQKYGNHSLMTWQEKEAFKRVAFKERWMKIASDPDMPSDEKSSLLGILQMVHLGQRKYNKKKRQSLRSNKFCVSFHRSLKNLEAKGYIQRMVFDGGGYIPLEGMLKSLASLNLPGYHWANPRARIIELTGKGKVLNVNTSGKHKEQLDEVKQ